MGWTEYSITGGDSYPRKNDRAPSWKESEKGIYRKYKRVNHIVKQSSNKC